MPELRTEMPIGYLEAFGYPEAWQTSCRWRRRRSVVDCVVNVDYGIVDLVLMCSMDLCLNS